MLDFFRYRGYANTMPSKKTPQKKSHFTKAFPILVFAVAIALAGFLGYKWYAHQSMLTAEKKSFETLRTDMKSLQAEFNKIDPGWEYSEGCHGNGQEIRYAASSCQVTLFNKTAQDYYLEKIPNISSYVNNISNFGTKAETNDGHIKLTYKKKNINCFTGLNNFDGYFFVCSGDAHSFYYRDLSR